MGVKIPKGILERSAANQIRYLKCLESWQTIKIYVINGFQRRGDVFASCLYCEKSTCECNPVTMGYDYNVVNY